jgi:c-di-GMP-binding flagellar brake protein YcgR
MDQQQSNIEPAASEGGMERRQHERRSMRTPAVLALPGRKPIEILVLDVSLGGLGTLSSTNVNPGTACRIYLNLPISTHARELISAECMVMRSVLSAKEDRFRVGLKFVDPPDRLQALILRFVGS